MFFIISLDLHVFIDNYPVQTASTTALPRLCVRHHKENGIFLKPVTILTGGEKISRRLFEQCGFSLLFSAIKRVIDTSHQLFQRFEVPFPRPALNVTCRFSSRQTRLSTAVRRASSNENAAAICSAGRSPRTLLHRSDRPRCCVAALSGSFARHITQDNVTTQMSPCVVDRFEVIDINQRQCERLVGGQQFIHIIVKRAAVLQPVNAS